jgi:hypothetical protein
VTSRGTILHQGKEESGEFVEFIESIELLEFMRTGDFRIQAWS